MTLPAPAETRTTIVDSESNRLVAIWANGSFISTLHSDDFQAHLDELVEQYGPPDEVVFRP